MAPFGRFYPPGLTPHTPIWCQGPPRTWKWDSRASRIKKWESFPKWFPFANEDHFYQPIWKCCTNHGLCPEISYFGLAHDYTSGSMVLILTTRTQRPGARAHSTNHAPPGPTHEASNRPTRSRVHHLGPTRSQLTLDGLGHVTKAPSTPRLLPPTCGPPPWADPRESTRPTRVSSQQLGQTLHGLLIMGPNHSGSISTSPCKLPPIRGPPRGVSHAS